MKTYKHLYPEVYAFANLYQAFRRARLGGKRKKESVAAFEYDLESNLLALERELREKTYRPGQYHHFYITEPKRRKISAAPFRDRVVHHALCQVIEPIFEARFIYDSYACRVGKGTHRALDRCQQFAQAWPYVLQCDVRQFFPSIDHAILYQRLAHWIADADVLWLIERILGGGAGVLEEEYDMHWFPGDNLMAVLRPRGLPIGNLTSQFWANVYLDQLDQFVKHTLHCRGYVRYMDDFLLFHDSKDTLHAWKDEVAGCLAGLRLTLHPRKSVVFPSRDGISFLGMRIFPGHRRLAKANVRACGRRLRRLRDAYAAGEIGLERVRASIQSWIAHASHAQTYRLRRALFAQVSFRGGHTHV